MTMPECHQSNLRQVDLESAFKFALCDIMYFEYTKCINDFVHIQRNSKTSVRKNIGLQIQNEARTGTTSSAIIPGVIKVIAIVIQIQENPRTVAFNSGLEYLR